MKATLDVGETFAEVEPYRAQYERWRRANNLIGWALVGSGVGNLLVVLCWFYRWVPVPDWVGARGGFVVAAIGTAHAYSGHRRRKAHLRMMDKHGEVFARVMRSYGGVDCPALEDK